MPTEQECREHWYGPGWSRRKSTKRRWQYGYAEMARLRRAQRRFP